MLLPIQYPQITNAMLISRRDPGIVKLCQMVEGLEKLNAKFGTLVILNSKTRISFYSLSQRSASKPFEVDWKIVSDSLVEPQGQFKVISGDINKGPASDWDKVKKSFAFFNSPFPNFAFELSEPYGNSESTDASICLDDGRSTRPIFFHFNSDGSLRSVKGRCRSTNRNSSYVKVMNEVFFEQVQNMSCLRFH